MRVKQFLSVILCVILLLTCGCSMNGNNSSSGGTNGGDNTPETSSFAAPEYDETKHIITFADFEPTVSESALKKYADCGFNTYPLSDADAGYDISVPNVNSEKYTQAILDCQALGLDVFIRFGGVSYDIFDFNEYDNVIGFIIQDEPDATEFNALYENKVQWINGKYEDLIFYVNLLPSYAGDILKTKPEGGRSAYEVYIDKYVETVHSKVIGKKSMGLDHYPLRERSKKNYLYETYLYDIMTVAQAAKQSNSDHFSFCIQSFSGQDWRKIYSRQDILFQMYTAMAFGADIFEFFGYTSSSAYDMMYTSEPTSVWGCVQDALTEIDKIDNVYANFKWDGVKTFVGTEHDEDYTAGHFQFIKKHEINLSGIKSLNASEDTVVGQLTDKYGNKGYMIVNYTEPTAAKKDKVSIQFEKANEVIVYKRGMEFKYSLENGKLDLSLSSGDGIFVIDCQNK